MRWLEADAYIFDIDGTLLNASGRAHYDAFHSALASVLGCSGRIDGVTLHGNTDIGILRAVILREGFSESDFDARLGDLLEHMCTEVERNRHTVRAEACPSVRELLVLLRSRGKLLGVGTGNLERIGWVKLEAAGLREYFDFGTFSDKFERRGDIFAAAAHQVRQRLGAKAAICVVGDTPADILAARENGMQVVAVATGIHSKDDLEKHSPDLCLGCCDELLELRARG